jgi:hypothetical protein
MVPHLASCFLANVHVDVQKQKEAGKEAAAAGRPRLSAGELRMQKGTVSLFSFRCPMRPCSIIRRRSSSHSVDFNDLNVSDIGTFKLHEEGKLMDFDVNILPQGGIYGCAYNWSRTLRACLVLHCLRVGSTSMSQKQNNLYHMLSTVCPCARSCS